MLSAFLNSDANAAGPLEPLTWQARPFLVFAPNADDPRLDDLRAAIKKLEAEVEDRDMAVIVIAGDTVSVSGKTADQVAPLSAEVLRRSYRVPEGAFQSLLVGLDGGVKMRATGLLDLERVFAEIDVMPIRRRELEERRQ